MEVNCVYVCTYFRLSHTAWMMWVMGTIEGESEGDYLMLVVVVCTGMDTTGSRRGSCMRKRSGFRISRYLPPHAKMMGEEERGQMGNTHCARGGREWKGKGGDGLGAPPLRVTGHFASTRARVECVRSFLSPTTLARTSGVCVRSACWLTAPIHLLWPCLLAASACSSTPRSFVRAGRYR